MPPRDRDHQPIRVNESADLFGAHAQFEADVVALASSEGLFGDLYERNGLPPLWRRERSFETLVRLILEQQVSLASANAAFCRLEARLAGVTPEGVLASTDEELRRDGFSRQKAGYVRGIADEILSGTLTVTELSGADEDVRRRLQEIRGIGPWTAACFLLFACGARDVWPSGDRALYVSMARNLEFSEVPGSETGDVIASQWAPYRSTAARMLWYDYLGGRSHVPSGNAGFIGSTGKVPS